MHGDCSEVQRSISVYYHTNMHNVFVGILCAIGLFLFTYKGYDECDDYAGNLAGMFAVVAALCPTSMEGPPTCCIPRPFDNPIFSAVHDISSLGFMLVLTYFSWVLFRKTDKYKEPGTMKKKRNKWYKGIGITMAFFIGLIICYCALNKYVFSRNNTFQWLVNGDPIFWLESATLTAFGISWFIKGRTILTDEGDKLLPPLSQKTAREHIL